jgi:hypothetical protein
MDGTSSYEFMKLMTHNCQREKVIDGEMAYDENEDVAWQGKEEEHGTCVPRKPKARLLCRYL